MSEITTEPVVEPVVETTTEPTTEPSDLAAEVAKWKALSRKNEERAKENDAAAKRLAEIDEANKTEAEKLEARAKAAEEKLALRDAADALADLVKEVADATGVPAAVLRGATREALEEHAETYLASLPTAAVPTVPTAHGHGLAGATVIGSDGGLDAAIQAAQAARNFPLAITLKQQKAAQAKKD